MDLDDGFRRISEIVQNLRAFSRLDAGDSYALFDINSGIQKTVIVARNELMYSAEVSLKLGTLPLVRCIEGEILQVLLNIVVNASPRQSRRRGVPEKGKNRDHHGHRR